MMGFYPNNMKKLLTVLMIVIGMMTFTMSAATPTLDKKQKTTFVESSLVQSIVGNVVITITNDVKFISYQNQKVPVINFKNANITNFMILQDIGKKTRVHINPFTAIDDVGWYRLIGDKYLIKHNSIAFYKPLKYHKQDINYCLVNYSPGLN
jgi:hypothetical protein